MERAHKRRIRLVKASLQLRLVWYVFLVCFVLIFAHSGSLMFFVRRALGDRALPLDFRLVLLADLAITAALTAAVALAAGILGTHRIAGPIYRFEQELKKVAKGDISGRIVLRHGDMLVDTCEELNFALANLRELVASDRRLLYEATASVGTLRECVSRATDREKVDEVLRKLERVSSRFVLEAQEGREGVVKAADEAVKP